MPRANSSVPRHRRHRKIVKQAKGYFGARSRTFKAAKDAVIKTSSPNLDLIPANIDLVAIQIELVDIPKREYVFKSVFSEIINDYDFLIIDCPPSLGLITLNALTASNSVIIPIQCEYYALEGLGKLLNTIKGVQNVHNNLHQTARILEWLVCRSSISRSEPRKISISHAGNII